MSWSTAALILKPLHETSAITHCRKKKGNQAKLICCLAIIL